MFRRSKKDQHSSERKAGMQNCEWSVWRASHHAGMIGCVSTSSHWAAGGLTCGSLASMAVMKRCRHSVCSGSGLHTSTPADCRNTVNAVRRLAWSTRCSPGNSKHLSLRLACVFRTLAEAAMTVVPTRLPEAQQRAERRSEQTPPGSAALLLTAQWTRHQQLQGLENRLDHGARTCSTHRAHQRSPWDRLDLCTAAQM